MSQNQNENKQEENKKKISILIKQEQNTLNKGKYAQMIKIESGISPNHSQNILESGVKNIRQRIIKNKVKNLRKRKKQKSLKRIIKSKNKLLFKVFKAKKAIILITDFDITKTLLQLLLIFFQLKIKIMYQGSNEKVPQNNSKKEKNYKFYRKNQRVDGKFQLVFPEIIGSLIDSNIITKGFKLAKWKATRDSSQPSDKDELQKLLPIKDPTSFPTYQNKIVYTWIGHSTAVISIGNEFNMMIDPVFSERASFNQDVGPKRFRKPACEINQLPKIHLVLVSHDHYDHLDQNALRQIYQTHPNVLFVAGQGSKSVFPKQCHYKELNWTQEFIQTVGEKNKEVKVSVTFVPACHWSRRGIFDQNTRLWGGFVIKTPKGKKIFYSGDTGYCQVFKQIGQQFEGFDLSILPIGAYQPRELLKNQHVNPEEAVKIHQDLKSKKSVGVHWGTFPLGSEHFTAAREDLKKACQQYKLEKDEFITIAHGDKLEIDY